MKMYKTKVIGKNKLTHDIFELILEKPQEFNFKAGQFITIKIEDQNSPCFRGYSIASSPDNKNIELCIKTIKGGRGSNWLNSLKKDDEINFIGPNGKFTLQNTDKDSIFIATGTGIAPFKSIIEEHLKNNKNKMHLIFGLRHVEDIFYKDLFENLAKKHNHFKFDITLSQPDNSWKGNKGRVTEILKNYDIKKQEVYICGLNDMITSVTNIGEKKGLPKEQIHFEKYN